MLFKIDPLRPIYDRHSLARDGGCTKPCCTVGAYGSQVHHAARDWADLGNTNVDELGLACGPDNRMVGKDGWTTRMNDRCEVEWIPPPHLDTGQNRINYYHQAERLLRPPDDDTESENDTGKSPPPEPDSHVACAPEPCDPWGHSDADEADQDTRSDPEPFDPRGSYDDESSPLPEPTGNGGSPEPEPCNPWGDDSPAEPRRTRTTRRPRRLTAITGE